MSGLFFLLFSTRVLSRLSLAFFFFFSFFFSELLESLQRRARHDNGAKLADSRMKRLGGVP